MNAQDARRAVDRAFDKIEDGRWLYLDNHVIHFEDAIRRLSADASGEPVYSYQHDIPPMANGLRCREKLNDLTVVAKFANRIVESKWIRGSVVSIWEGPDLTLIVIQNRGPSESWSWTCRGWREPEDAWMSAVSREAAENAALAFYMQKD